MSRDSNPFPEGPPIDNSPLDRQVNHSTSPNPIRPSGHLTIDPACPKIKLIKFSPYIRRKINYFIFHNEKWQHHYLYEL